ncbi:MAG: chorismate-binding protein, partial [Calditrichales bacterium]|nr:chorismate-binding protein [Calditrichales bacterium]
GRFARYSFIGKNPAKIFFNHGTALTLSENGRSKTIQKNLFEYLKDEIKNFSSPKLDDMPDFTGGIVGYLGYENISLIEDIVRFKDSRHIGTPDAIFGLYNNIIAFDHFKHQLIIITNVYIDESKDLERAYNQATKSIKRMREELTRAVDLNPKFNLLEDIKFSSDDADFFAKVDQAKNNILEGDIFQIVLSKRFGARYEGDLLNVYRALRIINPSPYMYFMELGSDFTIIGTSPEDLLNVKGKVATILPIAGTRKRGRTSDQDVAMEKELLADPKEIAEHIMLVDLARNDLGRVCKFDTVKVVSDKQIQRYSHVMHIVSRVEGILKEDQDCIDALKAAFPAGTLTGAPKIRAMQLIDQYEDIRRNVYGGAVGYIDFSGNLDMCIAIRTLFAGKNAVYWQAGAGIVADSKPELELKEIKNKSAVLRNALEYAEDLDADFNYR